MNSRFVSALVVVASLFIGAARGAPAHKSEYVELDRDALVGTPWSSPAATGSISPPT